MNLRGSAQPELPLPLLFLQHEPLELVLLESGSVMLVVSFIVWDDLAREMIRLQSIADHPEIPEAFTALE